MQMIILAKLNMKMHKMIHWCRTTASSADEDRSIVSCRIITAVRYRPNGQPTCGTQVELLESMQRDITNRDTNLDGLSNAEEEDDDTIVTRSASLHHRYLVNLDDEPDDLEADHILVLHTLDGERKTSNDIMSLKNFETLMFFTQLFQVCVWRCVHPPPALLSLVPSPPLIKSPSPACAMCNKK